MHAGAKSSHFQRYRVAFAFRCTLKNVRGYFRFHRRRALSFGKHRRGIVKARDRQRGHRVPLWSILLNLPSSYFR